MWKKCNVNHYTGKNIPSLLVSCSRFINSIPIVVVSVTNTPPCKSKNDISPLVDPIQCRFIVINKPVIPVIKLFITKCYNSIGNV